MNAVSIAIFAANARVPPKDRRAAGEGAVPGFAGGVQEKVVGEGILV